MEKGYTINCLDHGYVRYHSHLGGDQLIVEAARVSYKSPSKGEEQDMKLIKYLWKNKHTSPFEMAKIVLNIKMPIFVIRQYVRHRMQNLNEVSARYTELPNEFYIPTQWRRQDDKNRQGSTAEKDWNSIFLNEDGKSITMNQYFSETLQKHCKICYTLYEELLEKGVAREMARMVLPVNIYTEIYACWDIKNLLHFITLRDDAHAQAEIQVYGKAIKNILKELFPWTMTAYEKYKHVLIENEN